MKRSLGVLQVLPHCTSFFYPQACKFPPKLSLDDVTDKSPNVKKLMLISHSLHSLHGLPGYVALLQAMILRTRL